MAGRQGLGAQVARHVHQIAELDRLIAAHARNGRLAAQIGVGEVLHHLLAKAALVIEHIVRDAQGLGRHAGVQDILAGAAGALLGQGRAVVVELQGDAHHVIARTLEQGCGDRGIHPAGHGHHHARAKRQPDGFRREILSFADVQHILGHGPAM